MMKQRELNYDYGLDINPIHNYSGIAISSSDQNTVLYPEWPHLPSLGYLRSKGIDSATYTWRYLFDIYDGYEKFSSTERKPPKFNNCRHEVKRGVCYPVTVLHKRATMDGFLGAKFMRYKNDVCCRGDVDPVTGHFSHDFSYDRQLAYATMQPRFEGEISMINFIVELKDFKSLAKFLLNKPLRKLSNMFRRWKYKSIAKKFDLSKPLAEAHLTNEFALKPLLSDIYKITCQMAQVTSEVQKQFFADGLDVNSRHYTSIANVTDEQCWALSYQNAYPWRHNGFVEQITFNATMEYTYKYSCRTQIAAFMKYWGLVPNPLAIWNAIPFSFLVDYIVNIGDTIRLNSRDRNVLMTTSQYCESLLSERTRGHSFKNEYLWQPIIGAGHDYGPVSGPGYVLTTGQMSSLYTRGVTSPCTRRMMPRLNTPSSKQGWNILALARSFF